jgi:hypothetical protein
MGGLQEGRLQGYKLKVFDRFQGDILSGEMNTAENVRMQADTFVRNVHLDPYESLQNDRLEGYKNVKKCAQTVFWKRFFPVYCTHLRSFGWRIMAAAMHYSCAGAGGGAVDGGAGLPSAVCASINSTRVPSGS